MRKSRHSLICRGPIALAALLAAGGGAAVTLAAAWPPWLAGTVGGIGGVVALTSPVIVDRIRSDTDKRENAREARERALRPLRLESSVQGQATADQKTDPLGLLTAERSPVAFCGRRRELRDLAEWRDSEDSSRVLLLSGSAGVGKSRLALEFAARSPAVWAAGWLNNGSGVTAIDVVSAARQPTLILIDDADGRAHDVVALLNSLADHADSDLVIRVVLLVRNGAGLQAALATLIEPRNAWIVTSAKLMEIGPEGGPDDWKRWFTEAIATLATLFGEPSPKLPEVFPPDWNPTSFVMLQALALATILDIKEKRATSPGTAEQETVNAAALSPGGAAERLMAHEKYRWRSVAAAWNFYDGDSVEMLAELPAEQAPAIAALTLLGASDRSEAVSATLSPPCCPPPIQEKHSPPIPLTPASTRNTPADPGIPATASDHARDATDGQHAPNAESARGVSSIRSGTGMHRLSSSVTGRRSLRGYRDILVLGLQFGPVAPVIL